MRYLRRLYFRAAACSIASLFVTLAYVTSFHRVLLDGDIFGNDSIASPFVPDTLIYLDLIDAEDLDLPKLALAGVKNAVAPALLWGVAQGDWHLMAAINAAIAFVGLVYVAKLCRHFSVPVRRALRAITLIGLLPAVWYFSVGSLKELPAMTALTGFLYHVLKRQALPCLLWGVLLVSIRFQLALILPLFVLASSYAKHPLRITVISLLTVSAVFPIFAQLELLNLDVTAIYRESAGSESTAGAMLESLRDTVPGISALVVAIRVVQSVLEPLLAFLSGPFLFDLGKVSIQGFVYLSTLFLTLPAWFLTVRNIVRGLRVALPLDAQRLYALILAYGVPVGGFTFIHGRYLFPLTALVILGGVFRIRFPVSTSCEPSRPLRYA
jgi:hypothetical protein